VAVVVEKDSFVFGITSQTAAEFADIIDCWIETELIASSWLPALILVLKISADDLDSLLIVCRKWVDVHQRI